MSAKLTPWFPPEIKPVRKGWYECRCCTDTFYWTGERWLMMPGGGFSSIQNISWRGLASPPAEVYCVAAMQEAKSAVGEGG